MSADTTPVILVTNDQDGRQEFRIAVAQAWENAWCEDDEGEFLNPVYVVSVFSGCKPIAASTLDEAREALATMIEAEGHDIEYDTVVLDLSSESPFDTIRPNWHTYADLVDQADQWNAAGIG